MKPADLRCSKCGHMPGESPKSVSIYQMVINNIARSIRKASKAAGDGEPSVDAFQASVYIGIAFCKSKEDVITDILLVDPDPNYVCEHGNPAAPGGKTSCEECPKDPAKVKYGPTPEYHARTVAAMEATFRPNKE